MKICRIRLAFVCLIIIIICSMYSAAGGSSLSSSSSSSPSSSVFPSSNINNSSYTSEDQRLRHQLSHLLIVSVSSLVFLVVVIVFVWCFSPVRSLSCIYKLQVILYEDEDHVGFVQRRLDEIATTFRLFTMDLKNSHLMMIDTLLLLSQQSDHIISIFTTEALKSSQEETIELLKSMTLREMEKFDTESLVNFDDFQKLTLTAAVSEKRNYRVVTILLAGKGIIYKRLSMTNSEKLKEDLKYFANSIRIKYTLDVKVFSGLHKMKRSK